MHDNTGYQPNFLTVKDFCNRNQISRSGFYNLKDQGKVKTVKLGRKTLIAVAEEQAFVQRLLAA